MCYYVNSGRYPSNPMLELRESAVALGWESSTIFLFSTLTAANQKYHIFSRVIIIIVIIYFYYHLQFYA